jgi:hypothetical protein
MEKYFFIRAFINLLGQPRFFSRMIAVIIRVGTALIVLFSIPTFFQAGKLTFELSANKMLGGILFEIFFVVAVYAAVHVLLIRARDVDDLPAKEFYALPLGGVLIKMIGEVYASYVALVAVGGGIFVWFTAKKLGTILNPTILWLFPVAHDDATFIGGIGFMISGVLVAIAVLIVSYMLAEALSMIGRSEKPVSSAPLRQPSEQELKTRFGS